MSAHDVAIYSPWAKLFYTDAAVQMGGAELQTTVLAKGLAARGMRVAHIVYPLDSPVAPGPDIPDLVERSAWQGGGRLGQLAEARAIWSSFRRADARTYVVRGSGGHVPAAASFCRVFRRRFVFSTSSELDFQFDRPDRHGHVLRAYRASIGFADPVVVQTESQRRLALSSLPDLEPIVIPSYAEPAEPATGEAGHFLWINRLVPYKQPERYLELAAALPEARFKMVAGTTEETPAGYDDEIRAAAAELPNLELVGARPREELLAEMHTAAAVVTTSSIEGMPNTFLEAWARGVPVLSLVVDPDSRIATLGLGAVTGGSMERFVAEATALWRDAALRREIGERARRFVAETHSPQAVTDRWMEVLQRP